jgi:putative peptidoglycan lipid II flippase
MDIYLSSSTLPIFISTILIASINVNFIPLFFSERKKNEHNLNLFYKKICGIIFANFVILLFLFAGISFFSDNVTDILVPGFNVQQKDLYIKMLLLQIPLILISFFNEFITNILYCYNSFVIPTLNRFFTPIITIFWIFLFNNKLVIVDLIYANTLSVAIQLLVLWISLYKYTDFKFYFYDIFSKVTLKQYFKLSLPIFFLMSFTKITPVFDRFLLSDLYQGSISHIGYAFKLYSQISPIISTGIIITLVPILSNLVSNNDFTNMKLELSISIKKIFYWSAPILFTLFFFSTPIIKLLFERNRFTNLDTIEVATLLSIYIIALPSALVGDVIAKALYSLNETLIPMLVGIVETLVYIFIAFYLKPYFGVYCVPIAYAIYFNISWINSFFLKRKLGGSGIGIIIFFLKCILCSFLSVAIIYFPILWASNFVIKLGLIILGTFIYFLTTKYFFNISFLFDTANRIILRVK